MYPKMLRRIHHVGLRVADLDAARERWAIQFGLASRSTADGHVRLACAYEDYSLELIAGGEPGADHTAFELEPGVSLDDAASRLDALGVAHSRAEGALRLADPDGHGIELLPFSPTDDTRPAIARSTTTLAGFHPRRLGHINTLSGDLAATTAFYADVLGMAISDRLEQAGIWLRLGTDHHTVALVRADAPHFHHLALELTDWGELRVALDHLAQHGRWLAWGPLRHALGQNLAAYVRIPEERLLVELYCDMEQLAPDHQPREWADDVHSSNTWGILPPRSYFRFDPAAVEHERLGLEAQGHPLPPGDD
jgi:catechol 2,3-dioxygenase-like lactoylglutathione lyase family enzyme